MALTGVYGTRTRDVVAWIQAANGLAADGVYGPQTRRVIWWLFDNGKCGRWTGA